MTNESTSTSAKPPAVSRRRETCRISCDEFGQAYRNGFQKTVATVRQFGAKDGEAEEIAQAAWARGWERLGQLKDANSVTSWVNRIAVREFWDHLTRGRRFSPLLAADVEPKIMPSVNLAALDVDRFLDHPLQRDLVNAVYWEGRSTQEMAIALGITVGAVHHRLSRLRARLRAKLA
jgi:RNA polymerase sigma factor (sigma-70 family)